MARIRTIKPEFPQSETIGKLSRDARLLFIQLWTLADDAGRVRGAPRMLASLLYPYDDDAPKLMLGWLTELVDKVCIVRYEADGSQYLSIINWRKHQKIEKPSDSKLPSPEEGSPISPPLPAMAVVQQGSIPCSTQIKQEPSPTPPEPSPTPREEPPTPPEPSPLDLGPGPGEGPRTVDLREAPLRAATTRGTRLDENWSLSQRNINFAVSHGWSEQKINTEAIKFRNHWTSKSGADAVKRNWDRTWENWVLNDRQNGNHHGPSRTESPNASDVIRRLDEEYGTLAGR